jgi:phage regulator Rha-like protein
MTQLVIKDPIFAQRNFSLSAYVDETGKSNPLHWMSKDGFSILAMNLNGPNTLDWKLLFLAEFNRRGAALEALPPTGAPRTLAELEAIQRAFFQAQEARLAEAERIGALRIEDQNSVSNLRKGASSSKDA